MNGLLDKFDLALKTDIDRLPEDRRLYEIDSYDWLSAYPTHWNPIHLRLKLLEELKHLNDLYHVRLLKDKENPKWLIIFTKN